MSPLPRSYQRHQAMSNYNDMCYPPTIFVTRSLQEGVRRLEIYPHYTLEEINALQETNAFQEMDAFHLFIQKYILIKHI